MKKQYLYGSILISSILLFAVMSAHAYDDRYTHPELTKKAAKTSSLESYLQKNFGTQFAKGVEEAYIGNKPVLYWLTQGSTVEDRPLGRAANHFHNPLQLWNESYVNDLGVLGIYPWLTGWTPLYSNITWATGYDTYNGPIISRRNQAMGWDNAREYFYTALTGTTSTVRETNFAKTFQAVGQIMHLLQDMAVPAHVRNDFESHITFGFKPWYMPYNPFEYYVKDKPQLISNLTPTVITENRPTFPRLTDFWDTTQLRVNQDPNAIITGSGLSEYTSANFLSESTIFKQDFPSPAKVNTTASLVEVQAEDGVTDRCYYIFQNGQNNKLAAYSYFTNEQPQVHDGWKYNLNDDVYKDYAKILLPRAVGYSAGLLNYFFRGDLEVIHVGNGIKVKNLSAETMTSYVDSATGRAIGDIQVYYDTTTNVRRLLKSCSLSASDCWQTPPVNLLPGGETEVFPFPLPTDNIKPNQYIVVFLGKLGNEEGAVIGRVDNSWGEEWDNDLKGNHIWLTGEEISQYYVENPYPGYRKQEVTGGKLILEHTYAGYGYNKVWAGEAYDTTITDPSVTPCLGSTCLPYCQTKHWESAYGCFTYDFGVDFPIPVTPNTLVRLKVDEMSLEPMILHENDPNCSRPALEGLYQYQGIKLTFDNNEELFFTLPGQERWGHVTYFTPGTEYALNIFNVFRNAGIELREPLNLVSVDIMQELTSECTIEHTQRMVVDYIRLEER